MNIQRPVTCWQRLQTPWAKGKALPLLPADLDVSKEMLPQQQCLRKRFSLEILPSLSWFYCHHIHMGTTAWVFQGGWGEDTCVIQDNVISALICDRWSSHVINCQEEYAQAVSQKEFCWGFLSMLMDKCGAELEHGRTTLDFLEYLRLSNCLMPILPV